jgi:hypothetical protein
MGDRIKSARSGFVDWGAQFEDSNIAEARLQPRGSFQNCAASGRLNACPQIQQAEASKLRADS